MEKIISSFCFSATACLLGLLAKGRAGASVGAFIGATLPLMTGEKKTDRKQY